jgi:hypothetical protein
MGAKLGDMKQSNAINIDDPTLGVLVTLLDIAGIRRK